MNRRKGIDTEFVIEGALYSTEPMYYNWDNEKKYPYYEQLEAIKFTPEGITSLEEGEKWLLENHPNYYFGGGVYEKYKTVPPEEEKEPLDFCALAVPSYYEAVYQTRDRQKILKEIAREKGL